MSVARFLRAQNISFAALDTRLEPPGKAEIEKWLPRSQIHLGEWNFDLLDGVQQLVVSPGLSLSHSFVHQAQLVGAEIIGDIELFARAANAPIVAITGSNGKSTVTALLGEIAHNAGVPVKVGGNIGVPALDLLAGEPPDFFVLELSSFQLETTHSLNAFASVVLNISPDHMDRYASVQDYAVAKAVIYRGHGIKLFNRDDRASRQLAESHCRDNAARCVGFGLGEPLPGEYGIGPGNQNSPERYLRYGKQPILPVSKLKIVGLHNQANALAAIALASAMGVPFDRMLETLSSFPGLPHRTQWVAERDGVVWYNDSKGTNVGATIAAVEGLLGPKILIAGGEGKGADFSELAPAVVANDVRVVILYGKDAALIKQVLPAEKVQLLDARNLSHAVELAQQNAESGWSVLFSPACASFDMFRNYEHRGEVFAAVVKEVLA